MIGGLAIIGFCLSSYVLVRLFRPAGIMEALILFFCFFTGQITITGYVLSSMNRLADLSYWSLCSFSAAALILLPVVAHNELRKRLMILKDDFPIQALRDLGNEFMHQLTGIEKFIIICLAATTTITGIFNLMVVFFTPPNNWDSMTYHLARMAYYLQNNNLAYFDSNYWAQVVQPKNATILMIYSFLVSGKNENITQIVQYVSYWVSAIIVYGSTRFLGGNKIQGVFTAMVFCLLTENLLQATSTQNDLIITAFIGVALYSLLAFRNTNNVKYLMMVSYAMSFSLGIKSSAITAFPALFVIILYCVFMVKAKPLIHARNITVLLVTTIVSVTLFCLPAGYADNWKRYRNPIGPSHVSEMHSFKNSSFSDTMRNGSLNLLRYCVEFMSLDGLPRNRYVNQLQKIIREIPRLGFQSLGMNLESQGTTRGKFAYDKLTEPNVDYSYSGIMGFYLVGIAVVMALFGFVKNVPLRFLSLSSIIFLLTQSYIGPFDPWRGRYFIIGTIFTVPAAMIFMKGNRRSFVYYSALIIVAGCISAASAVLLRPDKSFVTYGHIQSVFSIDRVGQLTLNQPEYNKPVSEFEGLVPANASVALLLPGNSYEYPLFGQRLTRRLIPLNSFDRGILPIPREADYVLYSNSISKTEDGDIPLGADWFLRKLR